MEFPHGSVVVVVEDYTSLRRALAWRLQRGGAEVLELSDGGEVLGAVVRARREGRPCSVLLTDIDLPTLSGVEATRLLRAHGHDFPIIWMTGGRMGPELGGAAEALGVRRVLPKPFDLADAAQAVREACTRPSFRPMPVPSSEASWLRSSR